MKRFYQSVEVTEAGSQYGVLLDHKTIRTPAKKVLLLPTRQLADAVAEEWNVQDTEINTAQMPLTRLSNTAIDRVSEFRRNVILEISSYVQTDLVCYRVHQPKELQKRQKIFWDPVLTWFNAHCDIELTVTTGLLPVVQPDKCAKKVERAVDVLDNFVLAGLHTATTVCGSVVLGMAIAVGAIESRAAWRASLLDEFYQIEKWGADKDAEERHENLRCAIESAARFMQLSRTPAFSVSG